MGGFKSLQWAWSILLLSILGTIPIQSVSAVSEKQVNHGIHDNYDAEDSLLDPFLQTEFEYEDHLQWAERAYDKNLTKLNFFVSQNMRYGGELFLVAPIQKRYARTPATNNRALIYPFHSFF